ncbi:MAG TPA: UDP-N-acetylmuramate--L-alanine ligase [Acidimicrobiales bacterium]|nr:UDP-N-acetylmuramate--L-alanine ligase [Acidimicrobiales bacterium]
MAERGVATLPDLTVPRRIHVVGIGGTGMSAIATVLAAMGHRVTGSDLKSSPSVERLTGLGVVAHIGHDPAHVVDAEMVTASTAVAADNSELARAVSLGIPVLRRAEVLAAICATRRTIAVAGTHGKTTTSSMLALILADAGLRPSFIIGGDINEIGAGGAWDPAGEWLVVEADESDGTFLELGAEAVVVTSVEPDHLDFYGDVGSMEEAFDRFLAAAPGARVVCADDAGATRLMTRLADAQGASVITYGTAQGARYRMTELSTDRASASFDVVAGSGRLGRVRLAVPGVHNARNAMAAVAMAMAVGADFSTAQKALGRYGGVARRFEFRGQLDGVTFVDDYGHLPSEVRAALGAARAGGWDRIVAVFQPHRYSRTAALWSGFADAFEDADVVVVTDVYPSGEAPRPGVTGRLVADAVAAAHPDRDVRYHPGHEELVTALRVLLRPGDLCLTLGAGDLTVVPSELLGQTG